MLSQWLHDPGVGASTAESVLPFARSGGGRPVHGGVAGGGGGNGVGVGEGGPAGGGLDLDPSSVVEAHRHATQAEELRRDGRLLEALQEHLEASHCFLEAAERLHNTHGVVRADYDKGGRVCVDLAMLEDGVVLFIKSTCDHVLTFSVLPANLVHLSDSFSSLPPNFHHPYLDGRRPRPPLRRPRPTSQNPPTTPPKRQHFRLHHSPQDHSSSYPHASSS